mmetsp:Transcript_6802/g.16905  ORF Transcript_6802/g.16905 Transcript_6802/m.16905 type:complete len:126 (+) Transcript_6802:159-536(+)
MATQIMWLAVEDIMQVLTVVVCVYAGWSAWSLLLHLLKVGTAQPKVMKTVDFTTTKLLATEAQCDGEGSPSCRTSSPRSPAPCPASSYQGRLKGNAILEHYGVFGAAPGTWSGKARENGANGEVI